MNVKTGRSGIQFGEYLVDNRFVRTLSHPLDFLEVVDTFGRVLFEISLLHSPSQHMVKSCEIAIDGFVVKVLRLPGGDELRNRLGFDRAASIRTQML